MQTHTSVHPSTDRKSSIWRSHYDLKIIKQASRNRVFPYRWFFQTRRLPKSKDFQNLGLQANKDKSKIPLFSHTFKVPENKLHFLPLGQYIHGLCFWPVLMLGWNPLQGKPLFLEAGFINFKGTLSLKEIFWYMKNITFLNAMHRVKNSMLTPFTFKLAD